MSNFSTIQGDAIQFVRNLYKKEGYVYLKELCAGKRDGKHYEPHHLAKIGIVLPDEVDKYVIEKSEHFDNISNFKYKKDDIDRLINLGVIKRDVEFYTALRKGIDNNKYTKDDLVYEGIIKKEEFDYLYTKEEHLVNIKSGAYKNDITRIIKICNIAYGKISGIGDAWDALIKETGYFKNTDELHKAIYGCREKINFDSSLYSINIEKLGKPAPKRTDIFIFGNKRAGKSCLMSGLIYYMIRERGAIQSDGTTNKNGYEYCTILHQAIEQNRLIRLTEKDEFHYFQIDVKDDKKDWHQLTFYEMAGELFGDTYHEDFKKVNEKLQEHIVDNLNDKVLLFVLDYKTETETRENQDTLTEQRFIKLLNYFSGEALNRIKAIATIVTKWDIAESSNSELIQAKGQEGIDFLVKEFLKTYSAIDGKISVLEEKRQSQKNGWRKFFNEDKTVNLEYKRLTFSLGEFFNENCYKYNEFHSKNLYNWLMRNTDVNNNKK